MQRSFKTMSNYKRRYATEADRVYQTEAEKIFQMGDEAWHNGAYDEARSFYGQAVHMYSETEDDEGQANALSRLGELELSLDNFIKAEQALMAAIEMVKNVEYAQATHGEALLKLAKTKSMQANIVDALDLVEQAIEVAEYTGSSDLKGDANDLKALIYLQENKEDKALKAYEKAAVYHNKSGVTLKEAATLRAIARIEIKNKNYDHAHDVLEKCRDLYRENGDLLGEASALSAIGSLRFIIKDIPNARKALMKSVYLYGKVSHHFAEAEALLYLARVEAIDRENGDYERAKMHYKRSIELFDFMDNQTMKQAVSEEYYNFLNRINA